MPDQTMMPDSTDPESISFPPRRFLCRNPWEQLMLNPNDHVGPCCDLQWVDKRPTSLADVMDVYNSPQMQGVRQALIDGTALKTTCANCSVAGYGFYLAPGEENFYKGKTAIARRPPIEIVAGVSSVCNLRCVMCDSHSKPLIKDLGKDDLRFLDELGYDNIELLTITGGEPFVTPDSVELLRGLATRDTGMMKLRVITNG